MLQYTVRCEQHQPLAVAIKPPRGVDRRHSDEIGQCFAPAFGVTELADDVIGLIQKKMPRPHAAILACEALRLNKFAHQSEAPSEQNPFSPV